MEIASRINELMKEKSLSRYRLAKLTGVPYTTLIKILDGTTKNPQIETLSTIADFLGVRVDYLSGQSIGAIIDLELQMTGLTVDQLASKAGVRKEFILNIDNIDPDSGDYDSVERIAKVLSIKPSTLRLALARQETPTYDGPTVSVEESFANEDFSEYLPDKFDRAANIEKLRDEVKAIEETDEVLKPLGFKTENVVPEWATTKDIRDFKRMLEEDAPVMFDGVPIEGEARQRVLDMLTGLFWEAKQMNKKTYGRKSKKDNTDG